MLGLAPGSTREAVKQAYLREIKIWHPDRFSPDSMLRGRAEERTKALTAAYAALTAALGSSPQEGLQRRSAPERRENVRQRETSRSAFPPEEKASSGKWVDRFWRRLKAQWNKVAASPAAAHPPSHNTGAPKSGPKPSRQPRFDDVLRAARKAPRAPADMSIVWRRLAARRARYGRRRSSGAASIGPVRSRGPVHPVDPIDRIHAIGEDG